MRTVHESLFDLSLGAFAAIGLPVTFCSKKFVRRLEALAAEMREELEARRATPAG